ncbi:splicing factor 3B subunit 2 [Raphidocelis subcapitata]|uniref:Splicing factor 3B subunit 2 n=1 Tax=Raphidocelis subcapitata TaxID=307507 RepID=A0A2V0P1Y9_9CHLO|nr:splicing factor 3B subunit 2 [Raphidocelis subcapitata]|eukprot:GBF91105.1 splicing factor 3B subunit 2 [Raphidocelis subcapitata]
MTGEPAANGHAQEPGGAKPSKNDKRKDRKKRAKVAKQQQRQQQGEQQQPDPAGANPDGEDEDIVIEYVAQPVDLAAIFDAGPGAKPGGAAAAADEEEEDGGRGFGGLGLGAAPMEEDGEQQQQQQALDPFEAFKAVLERFAPVDEAGAAAGEGEDGEAEGRAAAAGEQQPKATTSDADSDDDAAAAGADGGPRLTKKQRKALQLARIAELKQATARPDVVEVWDVTAPDPHLLVFLKACRNTVPVPRHWSQKRKYLQGKRGLEKPPFKLPEFIEATGISEMRQAYREKEDSKQLKQKQRDRMSAKTGKMDIDYAVLHDAFFRHQTRPKLTPLGELYYEGKEFEAAVEGVRPGVLSPELREALGMAGTTPPPWLINMQRYGPPPSYPNLRIPGLNAPIPPGGEFGYQPGGWGKPPVDESGAPVYGDVFGADADGGASDDEVDKGARWGGLESEPEESSEEEEEEEEEEEGEGDEDLEGGIATDATGLTSAGLASSLPSGLETPEAVMNLRKSGDSVAGTESARAPQLYTVLEQKKAAVGQGLMGTDHVYVIPGAAGDKRRAGGAGAGGAGDVEVTLLPEELEGLDEAAVKALYEERAAEMRAAQQREDFSDLVAAQAAVQKRKIQQRADAKASKKGKGGGAADFKF